MDSPCIYFVCIMYKDALNIIITSLYISLKYNVSYTIFKAHNAGARSVCYVLTNTHKTIYHNII